MFIDSHCHLLFKKFSNFEPKNANSDEYNIENIIQRAINANVHCILNICTDLNDISDLQIINNQYKNVFGSVGVHPLDVQKHLQQFSLEKIQQIIKHAAQQNKIISIGEIGLDFYQGANNKQDQITLFHLQMQIADALKLPVSIHSRNADKETFDVVSQYPTVKGIMHCFVGTYNLAKQYIDIGYHISVSGIITFKNSELLKKTIEEVPLTSLLLETDAPFLSPTPFRGKINEPSYIPIIAEKIAEIKNTSLNNVAEVTSNNFFTLFNMSEKCIK